jgi:hypothetical protein
MAVTTKYGVALMSTAMVDHETVFNEATTIYDTMINPVAKSATTSVPPAAPDLGDLYLLPSGCVGYWSGHDYDIAIYVNGWRFVQPISGAFVWVEDTTQTYRFDAALGTWVSNALAITQLTSIPDVDAGSLTDGAVLTYDTATSRYALSVLNVGNLADVNATSVADGDTLVWDAATNTWLTGAAGSTMTNAEVKAAYEANANTNAFTDAEQTKLAGLEASKFLGVFADLTALQTAHPAPVAGSYGYVDAGASSDIEQYVWDNTDSQYVILAGGGTETSATIKTKYEANADTNAFTDAEQAKLASVEAGATADQTDAEIKTAYEANADTNAFTDAEQTKLAGIEAGATADQTGAEIVSAIDTQLGGTTWQSGGGGGGASDVAAEWQALTVVNGDFETGDLTGWTTVGATPTVVATPWGPTDASNGSWVVTGGSDALAGMTQDIVLGAADNNAVLFSISADIIKDWDDLDVTTIKVEILDALDTVLAEVSETGPANAIGMTRAAIIIPAQAGQAKLRLTVHFTRSSGTANDCGIDNITVNRYVLTGPISDTVMTEDTTASYTVTNSDLSGSVKHSQNFATRCTIVIPAGLTGKEPCDFIQEGAGALDFAPDAGVTIKAPRNLLSTVRQYDIATLMPDKKAGGDVYYLTNVTPPTAAPYSPVSGTWTDVITVAPTVNTYLDGKITLTHTGDMDATVWYTSVPAGDFDIVMRSKLSINNNSYFGCGFLAGTSAGIQQVMSVGYIHGSRSAYQWWRLDGAVPSYMSETGIEVISAFPMDQVEYWRITRVGTDLTWYKSSDGANWKLVTTEVEGTFDGPVDRIGMMMNTNVVGAGIVNTMVLEGYDTNGPRLLP